jgi:hypothetical protein
MSKLQVNQIRNLIMKNIVLFVMIALLSTAFTVNTVFSQRKCEGKKNTRGQAQLFSDGLSKKLSLTSKQQSKVYEITLSHCGRLTRSEASDADKETKKSDKEPQANNRFTNSICINR